MTNDNEVKMSRDFLNDLTQKSAISLSKLNPDALAELATKYAIESDDLRERVEYLESIRTDLENKIEYLENLIDALKEDISDLQNHLYEEKHNGS